jgi:hypothetical protein
LVASLSKQHSSHLTQYSQENEECQPATIKRQPDHSIINI